MRLKDAFAPGDIVHDVKGRKWRVEWLAEEALAVTPFMTEENPNPDDTPPISLYPSDDMQELWRCPYCAKHPEARFA